jgi:hypothetical protein
MAKKIPLLNLKALNKRQRALIKSNQLLMGVEDSAGFWEQAGIDQEADALASFVPPKSGIAHTAGPELPMNFEAAPDSLQLGPGGAAGGIVFGRDRPASLASGFGAQGCNKCSTIDIVVGRMSSAGTPPGSGPAGEVSTVSPSICTDAARIYISQLTDVDINFGIAKGRTTEQMAQSAVAIKADAVRLVGREGIKLTTGRSFAFKAGKGGEKNSRGGEISMPAPPIQLLAGNNDGVSEYAATNWLPEMSVNNLQGVAKGENTRDAFRSLSKILGQLIGTVYMMTLLQNAFNSIVGINWRMPHYGIMQGFTGVQYCAIIQNSLWHTRVNKIVWELNYAYPIGYKYVTSRNVYST